MEVLDTSIANVALPYISDGLAVGRSQVTVAIGRTSHSAEPGARALDRLLRADPPPPSSPVGAHANYQEFLNNYVENWNGTEPRSVIAGAGHLLFSWLFPLGGGLVAHAFAVRDLPQVELAVDRVNSSREPSAEADERR